MSAANPTAAAQRSRTHRIAVTAMLSAAATVLMFLEFPIPFLIPSFVELDFSELPAQRRGGVPGKERYQGPALLRHRRSRGNVQLPAGHLPRHPGGADLPL